MKEFNLTESPASDLIRKMLAVGLLEPAQERGRGQYRFVV